MLIWHPKKQEWEVKLTIEGKVVYRGCFKKKKDALDRYNLEFHKAMHEEANDDV